MVHFDDFVSDHSVHRCQRDTVLYRPNIFHWSYLDGATDAIATGTLLEETSKCESLGTFAITVHSVDLLCLGVCCPSNRRLARFNSARLVQSRSSFCMYVKGPDNCYSVCSYIKDGSLLNLSNSISSFLRGHVGPFPTQNQDQC